MLAKIRKKVQFRNLAGLQREEKIQRPLILFFEAIVQPIVHTLFIELFFHFDNIYIYIFLIN